MTTTHESNYEKRPFVQVKGHAADAWQGWPAVCAELRKHARNLQQTKGRAIVAVECYTGLHDEEIIRALKEGLAPSHFVETRTAMKSPAEIDALVEPYLGGNDPIFGLMSALKMVDFLDAVRLSHVRNSSSRLDGVVVIYGPGASFCFEPDLVVYADMPRWEGQLRQRRDEVSNLGISNVGLKASLQYKRSFFVDWRVCDRLKQETMNHWDYLLDTTIPNDPKLITGSALRAGLEQTVSQPFRVVPFFDPAPWGGQWMKKHCGLQPPEYNESNYGWCFDCVPEENSLLMRVGEVTVEMPSVNALFYRPQQLLGEHVFNAFGAEFPIRFDFLDTMGGGNLSFQVHPTNDYIRRTFGMSYTQDESYYILDAGQGASVYLGLREGIDRGDMLSALKRAQSGSELFPAEKYAAQWPAKKHDHFLIPAGTVHCSGAEAMVLEISATPYIFTFKLWDWGRLGLDGQPRPINLEHGQNVIDWSRDEHFAKSQLVSRAEPLGRGDGWREERTGLHELEFIETRRHWFTKPVPHHTGGNLNVLNLVEGREAIVESPTGAFEPFVVHYAETFIVPASVGAYTIRPLHSVEQPLGTMKAFVRPKATAGKAPAVT